jgi:penicillin-binding protein 2
MSASNLPRMHYEPWRAVLFYVGLAVGFSWLIFRLFGLQVLEFNTWKARADENRTRTLSVPPLRGIIYDRHGYILARNVASYNIVVTPAGLPDDPADIQEIYRQLSVLTGIPVNNGTVEDAKKVSICVPGPGITQWVALGDSLAPYSPVRIDCNVSEDMARTVREKSVDWPGIGIEIEPVRDYPTGSLTSDLVGFLGPIPATLEQIYRDRGFLPNRDKVGYSGVEAYFDHELAGVPGKRVAEVDVAGQVLRNLEPPIISTAGDNLTLTIDTRLQKAAETALIGDINNWNRQYLGKLYISSGAVIAMNPKTGEVLAMVSYPSFENNRMARIIPAYYYNQLFQDPRKPLLNHAVSDEYPPGSVFKLSTALGVLNEGIVTPTTVVQTPGELTLTETFSPNDKGFQRRFVDWINHDRTNPEGFGQLDFLHCIAYSSDVCFYKLGGGFKDEIREGLDIERMREYAHAIGYDEKSGIELLGEAKGLIPTPKWKRINQGENWSTGDTYIATIGQGYVLSTPLQVLMSAATIANDGKLMQPTLVRELKDGSGKVITLWRDTDGDFYHPCNVKDAAGKDVSGWCDSDYNITDNIVYSICNQQDTATGDQVSGWCGVDDQQKPVFKPGAWQVSPFQGGHMKWDLTVDKMIEDFQCEASYCTDMDTKKTVKLSALQKVQEGMRLAVTSNPIGTLNKQFGNMPIAVAGKTGTAEYCDDVARANHRCDFGLWPAHAWTVAYAPYDDPEIVIVAFAYNGNEGSTVAAPIVRKVMDAYFCLKSLDLNPNTLTGCE